MQIDESKSTDKPEEDIRADQEKKRREARHDRLEDLLCRYVSKQVPSHSQLGMPYRETVGSTHGVWRLSTLETSERETLPRGGSRQHISLNKQQFER